MTTLDLQDFAADYPSGTAIVTRLGRLAVPVKRWLARRRTPAALAHLDAHLLRDLGIEPQDHLALRSRQASEAWERICVRPVSR